MTVKFDLSTIMPTSEMIVAQDFKDSIVCNIIKSIENNIENGVDIEYLVTVTGYSRRYIQILFKERMGIPLGRYIRHRRIMRAATLLKLTSSSIIEISFRLNFDSQQTFTREFKKITGCTPQSYRRNSEWDLSVYKINLAPNVCPPYRPEFCELDAGTIIGYQLSYEEPIPCKRIMGDLRWESIIRQSELKQENIWLLTKISPSTRSSNTVSISTVIGVKCSNSSVYGTPYIYKKGLYAKFIFSGNRNQYHDFLINVYYRYLPYWGANRREGPDIECILYDNELNKNNFKCIIYIPIKLANTSTF